MSIILGLANFQTSYHRNKAYNLNSKEKIKILKNLEKKKIYEIDTSPDYGNSEKLIGNHCHEKIKVHSKLRIIPKTRDKYLLKSWVDKNLFGTLKDLKDKNIDTYFFHGPNDMLKYQGKICYEILLKYKEKGLFKKIGISIYDPKPYEKIIDSYNIESIQAPVNIFDHRMLSKEWLKIIKKHKITLYARSLFLQGILVDKKLFFKIKDKKSKQLIQEWYDYNDRKRLSLVKECLNFAFTANVKNVVLGLNSLKQIDEISRQKLQFKTSLLKFKSDYIKLIDPRKW